MFFTAEAVLRMWRLKLTSSSNADCVRLTCYGRGWGELMEKEGVRTASHALMWLIPCISCTGW